jgi:type IV pilus assembly protein PilA
MQRSITSKPDRASSRRGFTIVELLIVIVVIAVLAAITIVSYGGVKQRATNTAIVDAASKSLRMIAAYIAVNNTYPSMGGACVTTTSGCSWGGSAYSANSTFDSNVASIGTLPRTVPANSSTQNGVIYTYGASRTMNGAVQPATIVHYLAGIGQPCVLPVADSGGSTMLTSTTGYTQRDDGNGSTACVVSIPGPSA